MNQKYWEAVENGACGNCLEYRSIENPFCTCTPMMEDLVEAKIKKFQSSWCMECFFPKYSDESCRCKTSASIDI